MKLYRIYTEDKNRPWIERQTNKLFPGFTVIETIGFWQEEKEKSIIIEILASNSKEDRGALAVLRDLIKWHNHQESVLVTEHDIKAEFI